MRADTALSSWMLLTCFGAGCGAQKPGAFAGPDEAADSDAGAGTKADSAGDRGSGGGEGDAGAPLTPDGDAGADGDGDGDGDADGDGDDADAGADDGREADADGEADADVDAGAHADQPLGDGETCDGPRALSIGVEIAGDTSQASNDYEDDCMGSDGPEVAYLFVPEQTGVLTLMLVAQPNEGGRRWDSTLYLRAACDEGDLDCNDDFDVDGDGQADIGWSSLHECLGAGQPVHAIVDGLDPHDRGRYTLTAALGPCADGETCLGGQCAPAGQ